MSLRKITVRPSIRIGGVDTDDTCWSLGLLDRNDIVPELQKGAPVAQDPASCESIDLLTKEDNISS